MPPKVLGGRWGTTGEEGGRSGRVCGEDRGADIWALEDALVVLHSISGVRLGELKRWGIWRWRRRERRTPGREGGRERRDKGQVDGAARASGMGLRVC